MSFKRSGVIDGVVISKCHQFNDERGKGMQMIKSTDEQYLGFGEGYFSAIYPGVVKGWHKHSSMTLNYVAPIGNIKFVLFDGRDGSPTYGVIQEIYMGPDSYLLVTVPPNIWNGFKCIGIATSLVVNCSNIVHNDAEIERMDPFNSHISYDWGVVHK